jgi:3-hydroxybutyryl-CoA dehydrogenase
MFLKNTILATNTSSLSITEIASATKRQDKVLECIFKPVTTVKLVELIKGLRTSDSTIDISKDFADRIVKPVW